MSNNAQVEYKAAGLVLALHSASVREEHLQEKSKEAEVRPRTAFVVAVGWFFAVAAFYLCACSVCAAEWRVALCGLVPTVRCVSFRFCILASHACPDHGTDCGALVDCCASQEKKAAQRAAEQARRDRAAINVVEVCFRAIFLVSFGTSVV